MNKNWLDSWNNRYREPEYAYGTSPNEYLKEKLADIKPGKILFGAEGEGRNAVYAASVGHQVSAFDISIEGKKKAIVLANQNNVSIDYQVGNLPELDFENDSFDTLVLIYAHIPPELRAEYHKILDQKLKKGGIIIFEAFGKNHLAYRNKNPRVGGPPDLAFLFSTEEIQQYFPKYEIIQLEEMEIELNEGVYHNGTGSVVRFMGIKK